MAYRIGAIELIYREIKCSKVITYNLSSIDAGFPCLRVTDIETACML